MTENSEEAEKSNRFHLAGNYLNSKTELEKLEKKYRKTRMKTQNDDALLKLVNRKEVGESIT